ncbi:hypothetical protein PTKIN_Ptkin09bG0203000 [Pterospermum kingtungense]
MIRSCSVNVVCLLETRINECYAQKIVNKHFADWNLFHNYTGALNGMIWFLWKKHVQVNLYCSSARSISYFVNCNAGKFLLTAIYGMNTGVERRALWTHLTHISNNIEIPWVLGGDFNVIASIDEISNSNQVHNLDIQDFATCMDDLNLHDHVFASSIFTWTNRQDEGFVAKKLDRVLMNNSWSDLFPQSVVEFLALGSSDNSSVVLQLQHSVYTPPSLFRFFNFWTKKTEFLDVVRQSWVVPVVGSTGHMHRLFCKLKRLKVVLKQFNKEHFGDLPGCVKLARKKLKAVQKCILNSINPSTLIEQDKALQMDLHELLKAEESFFKQKSRVTWVHDGDQNTKFFHKMATAHCSRGFIRNVVNSTGVRLENFKQISNEFVNFF